MKYWCEIRTHGINDAMTRITSRQQGIHRGILAGDDLFEFFRKVIELKDIPNRKTDTSCPVTIEVNGPQGRFTVRRERGSLTVERRGHRVSPLTATLVVSGVLQPQGTVIAA